MTIETRQTSEKHANETNECVPPASAALTRRIARASTPPSESPEQTKTPRAHRWQQSMRARLGIDTSKSWADWAEEEEEEAAMLNKTRVYAKSEATGAEQGEPRLVPLSVRLRGGGTEGVCLS